MLSGRLATSARSAGVPANLDKEADVTALCTGETHGDA